jgi:hypothetical protein
MDGFWPSDLIPRAMIRCRIEWTGTSCGPPDLHPTPQIFKLRARLYTAHPPIDDWDGPGPKRYPHLIATIKTWSDGHDPSPSTPNSGRGETSCLRRRSPPVRPWPTPRYPILQYSECYPMRRPRQKVWRGSYRESRSRKPRPRRMAALPRTNCSGEQFLSQQQPIPTEGTIEICPATWWSPWANTEAPTIGPCASAKAAESLVFSLVLTALLMWLTTTGCGGVVASIYSRG